MSLEAGAPVDLSTELVRRLQAVGRAVTPEEIGELWIFPPLDEVEASAEFLLFTRMVRDDQRRLYSAGLRNPEAGDGAPADGRPSSNGTSSNGTAGTEGNGQRRQRITDHGTVPADRVPRLVNRFRRRLDEDEHEPVHVVIEGTLARWRELLPEPSGNGRSDPAAGGADDGTGPDRSERAGREGAEPAAA